MVEYRCVNCPFIQINPNHVLAYCGYRSSDLEEITAKSYVKVLVNNSGITKTCPQYKKLQDMGLI